MLISMKGPTGSVEKVRDEDEQHYIDLGYTHVIEDKTVELMSPAGRVVVNKNEVGDCLQRDGWSCLEDLEPEPEGSVEDKPEIPEEDKPEGSVEDKPEILGGPEPEVPEDEPEIPSEPKPEPEPEPEPEEPEISEDQEAADAELAQ